MLRRAIEFAPNYAAINRDVGNGLSAGLSAYARYIGLLQRSKDESLPRVDLTRPALYVGAKPTACAIQGKLIPVTGLWTDLFVEVVEFLLYDSPDKLIDETYRVGLLLSDDPLEGKRCKQLSNGKWVAISYNASEAIIGIRILCNFCGIQPDDIELRIHAAEENKPVPQPNANMDELPSIPALAAPEKTELPPPTPDADEQPVAKTMQQPPIFNAALLDVSSSIDFLPLSVRSSNALKRSHIITVEQLLGLDEEALYEFKNLGAKSVAEILAMQEQLQKTFEKRQIKTEFLPRVRQIIKNALRVGRLPEPAMLPLTAEEHRQLETAMLILDAMGMEAARQIKASPQCIQPIVEMFAEYTYACRAWQRLQAAYEAIPAHRRGKQLNRYLAAAHEDAFWAKDSGLLSLLETVSAISELPTVFDAAQNETAETLKALENLLHFLSLDYVQLVSKTMQNVLSTASSLVDLLLQRAAGRTLQELADEGQRSKERMRQKEIKMLGQIGRAFHTLSMYPLAIAFAENDEDVILTVDKLNEFYAQADNIDALLYYFKNSATVGTEYQFLKEDNAFIRNTSMKDIVRIDRAIANLPQLLLADKLDEVLCEICRDTGAVLKLVEQKFHAAYMQSGNVFSRGKMNMSAACDIVLKQYYPAGIRLFDEAEMQCFCEKMQELLGVDALPDMNRAFQVKITNRSVQFGRGIYIHPSFIRIPQDLLEAIVAYIRGSNQRSILYTELFETFKEPLVSRSNVLNRFALQGVLKYHCEQNAINFYFRKDSLSATNNAMEQWVVSEALSGPEISLDPLLEKQVIQVLSKRFPQGFRYESPIELMRLRRFAAADNGIDFAIDNEELKKAISACGILFDGKVYVVTADTKERIKGLAYEYFAGGAKAIFYEAFYMQHESWLFEVSIVSQDMLYCLLRSLFPHLKFTRSYFGLADTANQEMLESEILRVWGDDVLLTYEQLAERLQYIPQERIKSALGQNGDFIWNNRGRFTHISKLEVTEEERAAICEMTERKCNAHGYMSMTDLPLEEIAEYHNELSTAAVYSAVFRICLSDKFEKRGKIVARKGDKLDITTLITEYCRTVDKCSLEEIQQYENDLIGEVHVLIALEVGYAVMVRTDKDTFVAEKYVAFDTDAIDDAIALLVGEKYLPLQSFTTFVAFPHCGQPWNLFLLESYCRRFSKRYRFNALTYNSQNLGAVICRSCGSTYTEIMADAVAKSETPLDQESVRGYLGANGYTGKKSITAVSEIIAMAKVLRERGGLGAVRIHV